MTSEVVLVPGLWMPGAALALLAARLRRAGFGTRVFRYAGRGDPEQSVTQLAAYSRKPPASDTSFVGHSLGGLLVLQTLSRHRDIEARCAVLIGAPVRGCVAGRRFGRNALGRWMIGRSAPLWEEGNADWKRPEALGVIAGTLPAGLGRLLYRLPEPNDGVVTVSETEVGGMRERALVPVGHSGLIVSRRVADLTAGFLKNGSFA